MSFSLTRKSDYALVALAVLAEEAGEGARALSARQIAEQHGLPASLLMNVMKELQRAGIVCARRGAGGGYSLCRKPEELSILQIIQAIEGPVQVALCCQDDPGPDPGPGNPGSTQPCVACQMARKCPIVSPMQKFDEMVKQFLGRVTLRDLIEPGSPVPLRLEGMRA